jgi:hypothetical protein
MKLKDTTRKIYSNVLFFLGVDQKVTRSYNKMECGYCTIRPAPKKYF